MKAVVLAAGLGERLRPLTLMVPKPYLPLPTGLVIEGIIDWLRGWGIDRIYVVNSYMADRVEAYLGGGLANVEFLEADELLGTAGQLWFVRDRVLDDEDVVVVNGDVITDAPLGDALRLHRDSGAGLTVVACEYRLGLRYGVLQVGGGGELLDWLEKPTLAFPVSMGVYIIRGSLVRGLGRVRLDMDEFARGLVRGGSRVMVYIHRGLCVDMGTPGDYAGVLSTGGPQRHL